MPTESQFVTHEFCASVLMWARALTLSHTHTHKGNAQTLEMYAETLTQAQKTQLERSHIYSLIVQLSWCLYKCSI